MNIEELSFIIAGNQQQARDYCHAKGINFKPFKILHAPRCLRGITRGGHVMLVGTYYERKDWDDFRLILKEREFTSERDDY